MVKTSVPRDDDDSLEAVVRDMIRRSCVLMPDRASADRLIETVLLRAIAEHTQKRMTNYRLQLMAMLEEEYRLHAQRLLN